MYKQSDAALAAWRATERTLDGKVTITDSSGNETNYGTSDITSIAYDSGAWTGDTFSIGSTYENNITVTFAHLVEGLKQGYKVTAKIGIKLPDGTYEYCPLGVFIISDEITMDRNNDATTIKAYDQFCTMQGTYTSKLTYPAKITDVIAEIANMSGVELNTDDIAELPTQTDLASAISGQTYCTAIGWIAQFYGGFALFDRDGKLTIRTVTDASYILDASQYEQSGLTKNEATYQIGGMSVSVTTATTDSTGESSETTSTLTAGETTGSQIELTNNIMTQARLDSIWTIIKDITFYPYSLTWFGNPAIEAGDWLTLKDTAGNSFNVPNNSYTMTFDGGLTATSKADQTSTSSSSYSYSGTLSQTVKQLAGRQGATGNYIFGTDTTVEPTTAKIGDQWYKQNGNKTELWQYVRQSNGAGKWKLIVSDLTGEDIKTSVATAQEDATTATTTANNSVTTANNALSNAQTAISNAQTASNTANNATTVANNAISAANTASSDATTAITNANSAITKAESAISTANSSSDVANAVKQDVTNLKDGSTMTIAEIENGLALKLVKSDLDGYATENWASTRISATASGLQTQITSVKSTAATNTTSINALTSRADGFDVDIASVQTQVNNSAVGTQLGLNTSDFSANWSGYGSISTSVKYNGCPSMALTSTSSDNIFECQQLSTLSPSTKYTISFYAKADNAGDVGHAEMFGGIGATDFTLTTDWVRYSCVVTTESSLNSTNNYWYLTAQKGNTGSIYIALPKLELGSHATDWCLAPSEQATQNWTTNQISATSDSLTAQITSVQTTANTNKTNITTLSANVDGITTNVTSLQTDNNTNKTNISTLQQKATGFESNIATINTTVSTNTTDINSLKATSTSLSSTISSVQTQVNNSAVGTNLLENTGTDYNPNIWSSSSDTTWSVNNGVITVSSKGHTVLSSVQQVVSLNSGDNVALSVDVKGIGNIMSGYHNGDQYESDSQVQVVNSPNTWKRIVFYRTLISVDSQKAQSFTVDAEDGSDVQIRRPKLEKGSNATDYSANPADNATVISVSNITQTVDSLSTVVSGKVDTTTYTSKVTELANSIATKVESATYNSKMTQLDNAISAKVSTTDYNSEVTILTNQITSKVSQTDWANSAVGANLLTGTSGTLQAVTNASGWNTNMPSYSSTITAIDSDTSYTARVWISPVSYDMQIQLVWKDASGNQHYDSGSVIIAGTSGYSTQTSVITAGSTIEYVTIVFTASQSTASSVSYKEVKLEKGSYATPWCPAASEIANYSQIQQLSDNINLRVVKNDVINQINVSTESILIAGNKVHITGSTTIDDATITSAMIDSISADKITAGTLNAANVNVINLNANNISSGILTGVSFHQSSSGMDTWIDNNGIHNYDGSGHSTWIQNGKLTTNSALIGTDQSATYMKLDSELGILGLSYGGNGITQWGANTNFVYAVTASTQSVAGTLVTLGTQGMEFQSLNKFTLEILDSSSNILGTMYMDKNALNLGIPLSAGKINASSLSITGSKNAIVQTSAGWTKINAYETAEYYFGDIGETETGSGNSVKIVMDSLFLETVNTSVGYQVFITPYSDAKVWVDERNSDNFVVKSDTPNAKFAYEIKAKRKGYENTRLEIDEDFEKEAA